MTGRASLAKGREGEACARNFLEKAGFRILATNYRSRFGEIDLIAEEGETLVFVEVRVRKSSLFASAFESVDLRKQRKIIRTALSYLAADRHDDPYIRFDVIAVDAHGNCSHLRSAFDPEI
ncbi:YraN family protein [Desulfobotulus sp.]|jgi:putative endonuclease|uniref:YraN family protein n=1 Tax=Desulfobotulus sp. TaxID=1940337 RepID=UPI002A359691|nr:YraN family protein [Desulfobotulus sp.]MDY0163126.1 YraN family protein [Desulfobotulus sp.]